MSEKVLHVSFYKYSSKNLLIDEMDVDASFDFVDAEQFRTTVDNYMKEIGISKATCDIYDFDNVLTEQEQLELKRKKFIFLK